MTAIENLLSVDWVAWLLTAFIILFGIVAIAEIIGKISTLIGKPTKWVRQKNNDHEQIKQLVEHQKYTDNQMKEMSDSIKEISEIVLDSQIEKMRWDILDFASSLSNNRAYTREQFSYVFKVYDKYEGILKAHDLKNGEVEESMAVIRERYHEFMNKQ